MLKGDNSVGEFYSVALTNNKQQVSGQGLGACAHQRDWEACLRCLSTR